MKTIRTLLLCTSLLAGTVAAQENSLVLSNGLGFVDTPYKAGTLEVDDAEDLIINCDEVDCTTFVEYALAMALCPQQGRKVTLPVTCNVSAIATEKLTVIPLVCIIYPTGSIMVSAKAFLKT